VLPNGSEHAFLLIPRGEDLGDVEEGGDAIQDGNASLAEPAPITSPAITPTQPNLTPRGMVARSRARLARRYRIAVVGALAKPVNLTASALNTYQIKLQWQGASGQSQTGFRLFRCSGCSNPRTQGRQVASVGASVITYTDGSSSNPLTENTAYTYQVTASNVSGQSGSSNAASVITKTEPAPNLGSHAYRRGLHDVVVLRWIDNSTDEDRYHIERCTGSTCTNFSEIAHLNANATIYLDTTFPMHLRFRYRVRAHSPGGYSGYSNIRTETIP